MWDIRSLSLLFASSHLRPFLIDRFIDLWRWLICFIYWCDSSGNSRRKARRRTDGAPKCGTIYKANRNWQSEVLERSCMFVTFGALRACPWPARAFHSLWRCENFHPIRCRPYNELFDAINDAKTKSLICAVATHATRVNLPRLANFIKQKRENVFLVSRARLRKANSVSVQLNASLALFIANNSKQIDEFAIKVL